MFNSKKYIFLIVSILMLFSSCNLKNRFYDDINENILKIHFINVGQGDSTLLQFNNKNLLIDSGPLNSFENTIKYLKKLKVKQLDYVIATHPHEDHIGAMSEIIKTFEVKKFYAPKVTSNTDYFYNMIKELKKSNIKINIAKDQIKLPFDAKIKCVFLSPNSSNYTNLNNYSAVLKITYGRCNFLFTGDAESLVEQEILDKRYNISCQVLKLGHHGSSTSTCDQFLEKTSPNVAIASCGKNNIFNHPNKKTLQKLAEKGVKLYRTDIDGTIVLVCNGSNIKKSN
ncbi:ComEC/Rec2 family competence protein [Clostridium rectalis]|uniref:ComEC/Rec2 family competence protein n=1 Tax=Clostridium rectalis TaxID=2040295 RepID=UPI000F64434A|nr:ComEC/Rec2 family competence protein [Clostridium rectalis]